MEVALRQRLGRVALGQEPADLILHGGDLVNVYTGEILQKQQILIAGDRIAYVGPEVDFPAGKKTKTIDFSGQLVIPGLIDGHIHLDILTDLAEFSWRSLVHGTTTVITECNAPSNALGLRGILLFLEEARSLTQRIFATAPVISFLFANNGNGQGTISLAQMIKLLDRPEITGLGEIYWTQLLHAPQEKNLTTLIEAALSRGKTVEGHGAGAKNQKLASFVAHGINSCHEPITADEVTERLRSGLATMIREGSIRKELEAVIGPLARQKMDLRRAILVSDGVWPHDLINTGHMDYILQKAVDLGLNPVQAIQMATLNVAEHFNLDGDLGGIAPGKCADLVIIPDLKKIQPQLVICRGQLVAEEEKIITRNKKTGFPAEAYTCVNLPRIGPEYFHVPATPKEAKIRGIQVVTDIINRETAFTLPVINGVLDTNGAGDILKVAVINRFEGTEQKSIGFIQGFGLREGALASSFSFDEGNLVVIGGNDSDMANAVNRISELSGGLVYCRNGLVEEEIPMPLFGTASNLPLPELASRCNSLLRLLMDNGCPGQNPLLTLFTITFTVIPSLRLRAKGYWRTKESCFRDIFIND